MVGEGTKGGIWGRGKMGAREGREGGCLIAGWGEVRAGGRTGNSRCRDETPISGWKMRGEGEKGRRYGARKGRRGEEGRDRGVEGEEGMGRKQGRGRGKEEGRGLGIGRRGIEEMRKGENGEGERRRGTRERKDEERRRRRGEKERERRGRAKLERGVSGWVQAVGGAKVRPR